MACSEKRISRLRGKKKRLLQSAPAAGGNDTNQLNTSETVVKSVRIYIFDGSKLDRMQYFDIPDGGIQLNMRQSRRRQDVLRRCQRTAEDERRTGSRRYAGRAERRDVLHGRLRKPEPQCQETEDQNPHEAYFLPFYGQTNNVTLTENGALCCSKSNAPWRA